MMQLLKKLLFTLLVAVASGNSFAAPSAAEATAKGPILKTLFSAGIKSSAPVRELKEYVTGVEESATTLLIAFHLNSAFYSFPKQADAKTLKKLLQESQRNKSPITVRIEATSQRILSIEFAP